MGNTSDHFAKQNLVKNTRKKDNAIFISSKELLLECDSH